MEYVNLETAQRLGLHQHKLVRTNMNYLTLHRVAAARRTDCRKTAATWVLGSYAAAWAMIGSLVWVIDALGGKLPL